MPGNRSPIRVAREAPGAGFGAHPLGRLALGLSLLAATLGVCPGVGHAQTLADLDRWGQQLGSDDAATRAEAWEKLSGLPDEALPVLRERVRALRRPVLESEDAYEAVRKFRHSMGSRRADDMVDIAPGVLPWLEERRDRLTVKMAEKMAILRSLERIGTTEAYEAVWDLFGHDMAPWRMESSRVLDRAGIRALPALLLGRQHESADVRRLCRRAVEQLGAVQPGPAVQRLTDEAPDLLPDLLRAFAATRLMDAMPLIISFVDDEDADLRAAARTSMESYGRNGIWQLRRAFVVKLGEEADVSWGWQRTMATLWSALDARRLAPLHERLEAGLALAREGDALGATETFDALLRRAPTLARRGEMAPAYAAVADAEKARGQAARAAALYRRAAWLAGPVPAADEYRAEAGFLEAEQARMAGIVDPSAYEAVLALAPEHEGAAERLVEEEEEVAVAAEPGRSRGRVLSLAVLLAVLGLFVLFGPRLVADDGFAGLGRWARTARLAVERLVPGPAVVTSSGTLAAPTFDDDDEPGAAFEPRIVWPAGSVRVVESTTDPDSLWADGEDEDEDGDEDDADWDAEGTDPGGLFAGDAEESGVDEDAWLDDAPPRIVLPPPAAHPSAADSTFVLRRPTEADRTFRDPAPEPSIPVAAPATASARVEAQDGERAHVEPFTDHGEPTPAPRAVAPVIRTLPTRADDTYRDDGLPAVALDPFDDEPVGRRPEAHETWREPTARADVARRAAEESAMVLIFGGDAEATEDDPQDTLPT